MNSNLIRKSSPSDQGFTLVEVMIAIVLLVMISISIYQATTQTFRYRAKLINEGDFYAGIRLSMGLLERDIASLFSPVMMNPKLQGEGPPGAGDAAVDDPSRQGFPSRRQGGGAGADPNAAAEAAKLEELQRSELGQVSDYWLGATDITGIRPSRFQGTENRLQFVSASHQRVYKGKPESEYTKIIYELREDREAKNDFGEDTQVLVKITDPNVFDDVEKLGKKGTTYPLLRGIKSFKLRYYRRTADGKGRWERAWDNSKTDLAGLYPDLVELTMNVIGPSRLAYTGVYIFKPEAPFYGLDPSF